MTDLMSTEARSKLMSRIRSKDTKPEMIVRRALHARGFRYVLHDKRLPGSPDLVFPKYRAVIFVHGCFWHRHKGCSLAYVPKSRQTSWTKKFANNVERDKADLNKLMAEGWRVLIVWECAVRAPKKKMLANLDQVARWVSSSDRSSEVSREGVSHRGGITDSVN